MACRQSRWLSTHLAIDVHELLGQDAKALGTHKLVLGMNDQKVDAQVLAGSRLLDKAAVSRVTLGIMLLALGDLCLGLFELTVAGQVNRIDIAATRAADACNDLKALKLNLFVVMLTASSVPWLGLAP